MAEFFSVKFYHSMPVMSRKKGIDEEVTNKTFSHFCENES